MAESPSGKQVDVAPLGLLARLGAALLSPRAALCSAAQATSSGRSGTDVALLMALVFAVADTQALVSSIWIALSGDVTGGLVALVTALTQSVKSDLVFLLGAAAAVYLGSGRARSLNRDVDLACVAYVPIAAVAFAGSSATLIYGRPLPALWQSGASYAAYLWAAAIVGLAIAGNRREWWSPPPRRRRFALGGWIVAAVAAANLVWASISIARHPERVRPVVSGDLAPDFLLPTIDASGRLGGFVRLSEFRGRVVVLDFWATWCGPCRKSMPVIEELQRRYADRGLAVLSVNTEGPAKAAQARRLVDSLGLTSLQLSDDGRASRQFRVTTIPHIVIVDQRGVVREVHRGLTTVDRLRSAVTAALDELW